LLKICLLESQSDKTDSPRLFSMSQSRLEGLASQFSTSTIASKPATPHTARYNAAFAQKLPLDDPRDFEEATRGLLFSEESLIIKNNVQPALNAWNMGIYDFIKQRGAEAPETVNPSLWRQARLNNIHGFFEVLPGKESGVGGIYQCRGYDISWVERAKRAREMETDFCVVGGLTWLLSFWPGPSQKHDLPRIRQRGNRNRPRHLGRIRCGDVGSVPETPRAEAGDCGYHHAFARGSFWRYAGDAPGTGRRRTVLDSYHRA
jgi:hypothetical protein